MEAGITNYGAKLVYLMAPDKTGAMDDVVLGYDNISDYLSGQQSFGAIIGRFANRIDGGKFKIDSIQYGLATNSGGRNHIHGGHYGFSRMAWRSSSDPAAVHNQVKFSYFSKDMEEGYPGNLEVEVAYTLNDENELIIDYNATTDQSTIINLTNHAYFNLAGVYAENDIHDHKMTIFASKFVVVRPDLIPTGEIRPTENTPMDFKTAHVIGDRIDVAYQQLQAANGYDHCYVLDKENENELTLAAIVDHSSTGRRMEVYTTSPAVQFYAGNHLNGTAIGKGGISYQKRAALCLEAQNFPDAPNHEHFPSSILRPNQVYSKTDIYKFGVIQ